MSNSKVRKQIEAQEAKGKVLEAYKKKADFILNFQVCKAYFKDSALSIMAIVEKILKAKYNLPWQEKIIRKVLMENLTGHTAFRTPADEAKWKARQAEKREALKTAKEAAEDENPET
jgi:hypothetical protein